MIELAATEFNALGFERAASLLREVFRGVTYVDAAYLRWGYSDNPMGAAIAVDAREGDSAVAHLAGRALLARWAGREVRGYLIHHAATRASHRGQHLFGRLLDAIVERARERGAEFLIAVANAKSAPIFVARHGFRDLGPLDVELGVGLPPRPGASVALDFETLWSPAALAWRLSRPASAYRTLRVGDALQLAAPTELLGAWVELDWVAASELASPPPGLARRPRLGARIGLDPRPRQRKWPAVSVPRWLRPSPLQLVFRELVDSRELARSRLRFGLLDFDAF